MDLNLVKVFVAIYEAKNLTLAGARLFVTQSAISQSLTKLRAQLGDPLFERREGQMQPTPLAEQMYPMFRDALVSIDSAIDIVHGFDPATSHRTFRIALSELGEIGWLPRLTRALRQNAPHSRFEVVNLSRDHLSEQLTRGTVDLAITPINVPGHPSRASLKQDAYWVVLAPEREDTAVTVQQYAEAEHLSVLGDAGVGRLEAALRQHNLTRNVAVMVQRFAVVPGLLTANPELIATVPETLARAWAAQGIVTAVPLPVPGTEIDVYLYKRQTTSDIMLLNWLFDISLSTLRNKRADFSAIT